MAERGFDEETEKPLDPATERLRRKMIRLLAVSVGTMLVAVMAVLGAVVYKAAGPRRASTAAPTAATLSLPAGAVIEDVALGAGEALLHVREGAAERLLRVDLATGRVLGALDVRRP